MGTGTHFTGVEGEVAALACTRQVRGIIRRMTKSATVAPMHNMTAAANAAEEKLGEDARNFQNRPSIAITMHANATSMNLCNWSAYALSLNVVSRTRIANKQSQDAAPR